MTGKPGRFHVAVGAASLSLAAALITALAVPATASSSRGGSAGGGQTGSAVPAGAPPATASSQLPAIHHVFVITLENEGYAHTFGDPAADPYLATTLPSEGALLTQYFATGHESNDNYIAMISGQGPNPQNQADCQYYDNFLPPGITVPPGQAVGTGCVYPRSVKTVANQLTSAHLTWKGYMQDMGNDPARESAVCGHPALNSQDNTQSAVPGDGYVTRHDPFVYLHSIINNAAYCDQHVVPLGSTTGAMPPGTPAGTTGLATDLESVSTTPNFSFITPNVCNDGHDYPCVNQPSGSSALADIDAFLSTWVPIITSSPAFQQDGLLVINFDESDGPQSDSRACCGEVAGPDTPLPGITGLGGGRVGAVLLSPFIAPGTVTSTPYNHYSLLASIENIFHLSHLGYARTVTSSFGSDVFSR